MKPIKGLAQDTRPENQMEGTYPFGKNGIQFDLKGTISNEKGFKQFESFKGLASVIEQGYQINGILSTDSSKVIVFYTNNVNSRILLFDVETDTVGFQFDDSLLSYKLGFKIENYITGQVQRNHKGELVCAFTDKVTFPKYLNIDNPEIAELKDWNLFPEFNAPDVSMATVNGGTLDAGAYFVALRYYKLDGTVTSFTRVYNGIAITGDGGTSISDKSVEIAITNQDTAYAFIELAIISKIGGVTSAKLLTKIPVNNVSSIVEYTGDNYFQSITLEEVLVPQVFYNKVETMGQLNDALYIGKLESEPEILDMQKYANLVELVWTSELIDMSSVPEEHKNGTKKGFMHEETYACYIRYRKTNGTFTPAFTIPGPVPISSDLLTSSQSTAGGMTPEMVYKMEDTITTFSPITFSGLTGTYQNETEVYPTDDNFDSSSVGGIDNKGQLVRHHKMPSLRFCRENLYPSETEYGKTKLDILGLQAYNVIIPPKYAGIIDGYEILYAKRTIADMTVYGQGLLLQWAKDQYNQFHSNGSNTSIGTVFNGYILDATRYHFHAFDILFNKPTIQPSFVSAQYKLSSFIKQIIDAGSSGTFDQNNPAVRLIDMMDPSAVVGTVPAQYVRGVANSKYLINNVVVGDYNNLFRETSLSGVLQGSTSNLPVTVGNLTTITDIFVTVPAEAYLINLMDTKKNIYESFYAKSLVSAGNPKNLTDNSPFWGGDVFVVPYTFHTYGPVDTSDLYTQDVGTGDPLSPDVRNVRIVNRVVCETISNLYARYEITGNIYSKWFPNSTLTFNDVTCYPASYNLTIDPNQFGYSKGSEAINDFITSDIYNPYRDYIYKFPYRVHRGGKLSRQNTRSWKTFLALDYYECQKNMGHIQHLEGMDDRLLIHHENALFLTQDKAKLDSGILGVTLGTGDIFQFEPQEANSSPWGYNGTQHDLACVRTPIGYVFADAKQGELYLFKSDGKRTPPSLINNTLHRFLRDYLKINGKNTFLANGITIGWDQKYKRIFATVKNMHPSKYNEAGNLRVIHIVNDLETDFPSGLVTGDVIFYQGRYLEFVSTGTGTSGYDCPPDECECETPDLTLTVQSDPVLVHCTWTGTAGNSFQWYLYEQTNTGSVLVTSGTTTSMFQDFDETQIEENKIYYFSVYQICGDCISSASTDFFGLAPVPIVVIGPEDPTPTIIHYHTSLFRAIESGASGIAYGGGTGYNAVYAKITVNGVLLTSTHGLSTAIGAGSSYLSTSGSLTSATIVVEFLDGSSNPATFSGSLGGLVPHNMYSSTLTPITGVVSGSNNHIITWTGVDIAPTFTTYVHIDA